MNDKYIVKFARPGVTNYNDTYTTQLLTFSGSQVLHGISTCDITLNNNLDFTIEKFDRFQLIKIENSQDIVLFEGYVDSLDATIDVLMISGKGLKELLNYKFCLEDKIYSNITVEDMLNDICFNWKLNVPDGIIIDGPEFDTLDYTIANFEVNYGESLYTILDRLSKIWDFVFNMTSGEIITLRKYPGVDRTQNDGNFTRLTYDKFDKLGNNITNLKSTSTDKYSVIIGRNKEIENEKFIQKQTTPSMDSIGLYYMYENGFLQGSTEPIGLVQLGLLLDQYSQEVRILDFDIETTSGLNIGLGDLVKVEVTNASNYLNYNGTGFITEKKLSFDNGLENITYTFAGGVIQTSPNLLRNLYQMKGGVNTQPDLKTRTQAVPILLN